MKSKLLLILNFWVIVTSLFAHEEKHVLFLSSYNSRFPTYFKQIEGVKSVLNSPNIVIDVESMDSKRFSDSTMLELFFKLFSQKLEKEETYDAIIAADDNAFNFCLQHHKLLKEAPLVFLGVNNVALALEQNKNDRVTGVVEAVSLKETIDLMLNLFPQSNKIYAISDNTTSGKQSTHSYMALSSEYPDVRFELIDMGKYETLNLFENELKAIPANVPVLLLSAMQDASLKHYDFHNSLHDIRRSTNAPIFHLWEHGLGDGILGGKIISHTSRVKRRHLL